MFDRVAFRASLRSPARIDQHHDATGACRLVAHMLDDLVPRGVMDGLREHPRRRDWPNGSHHIMRIATEEEPDDRQDAAARSQAAQFGKLWVGLLGRRH